MSTAGARRRRLGQERLRLRAGRMFDRGVSQAVVMRRLGVARQRVNDWHTAWAAGGLDELRSRGPTGPKPRISGEQWAGVEARLLAGPVAYGFDAGVWTLPRIARVIKDLTGVRYDQSGVWRLLHRLGWTLQRPARQAAERDEAGIARWVKVAWPRIRKRRPAA
jgi:transposase